MTGALIWIAVGLLFALSWVTSMHLALRLPSRAGLSTLFEQRGLTHRLDRFYRLRPQYMITCAILRTIITFAFFVVLLRGGADFALNSPSSWITAVAVVGLALVFGVAVPNAWAKYCGEALVMACLPLLGLSRWLLLPVTIVSEMIDPVVRRLSGAATVDARSYADELEQEIRNVVTEGELHGAVDEDEADMIESVIELSDTRVDAIMTPRTQIVAMPVDSDMETVLATIRAKGHSRIPVYDQSIDTVVGVLYAKDLLRRQVTEPFKLSAMLRRTLFIPESKLVRDLLREFQAQKVHIAIVLDEYGGTAGLVTIEDILEELVGEITDEYDATAPQELKRIDEFTVEVDARMKMYDVNDQLGLHLPDDQDFETIGGFVFSTMGKIPTVGEQFDYQNINIQVLGAEPRRVTRLRLTISPAEQTAADAAAARSLAER